MKRKRCVGHVCVGYYEKYMQNFNQGGVNLGDTDRLRGNIR
jgi:hypothetical protein